MKKILDVKVEAEKFYNLANRYMLMLGRDSKSAVFSAAAAFAQSAAKATPAAGKSRTILTYGRDKRTRYRVAIRQNFKRGNRNYNQSWFEKMADAKKFAVITYRGLNRAAWLWTMPALGMPYPSRVTGATRQAIAKSRVMNATTVQTIGADQQVTININTPSIGSGMLRIASARGYRTAATRMRWAIQNLQERSLFA